MASIVFAAGLDRRHPGTRAAGKQHQREHRDGDDGHDDFVAAHDTASLPVEKAIQNALISRPNVATIMTLGDYNYPYTRASNQSVSCPNNNTCNTKVGCRNFNVTGVTNSLGAAGLLAGGVTNDGKRTESTKLEFTGGLQPGSVVGVTMVQGTDTLPTCTGNFNQCSKFTIECPN